MLQARPDQPDFPPSPDIQGGEAMNGSGEGSWTRAGSPEGGAATGNEPPSPVPPPNTPSPEDRPPVSPPTPPPLPPKVDTPPKS